MKYRLECYLYEHSVSVVEKITRSNNAITMCETIKKLKDCDDLIDAKLFYDKTNQEILSMDGLRTVDLNNHLKYAKCFNQLGGRLS